MLSTLYLLHYNNYYNRIVKQENSISEYQQYVIGDPIESVNFIPNDFIDTTQVVNWIDEDPDYLLEVQDGEIHSRWFIISTKRTTHGQLELTLHRDTVIDFYDEVVKSPCFIEKALPKSIRDPAIYNSEDMTFNEIKEDEKLLYDETECPWIVGYIPRNYPETNTTVHFNAQLDGAAEIEVTNLADYSYYQYNNTIVQGSVTNPTIKIAVTYMVTGRWPTIGSTPYSKFYGNIIKLDQDGNYIGLDEGTGQNSITGYLWSQTYSNVVHAPSNAFTDEYARIVAGNMPQLSNDFKNLSAYVSTSITKAEYNELVKDNGKLIYETSTQKYYRIRLVGDTTKATSITIPLDSDLGIKMKNKVVTTFDGHTFQNTDPIGDAFTFTSDTAFQKLTIEPVELELSVIIPKGTPKNGGTSGRYTVSEAPYDIFCIPYSDNLTIYKNNEVYISKTNKSAALSMAQQFSAQIGTAANFDIQLLPYCPVRHCINKTTGQFDIGSLPNESSASTFGYNTIKSTNGDAISVLLWATTDNCYFPLNVDIPEEQDIIEKKVKSQTDFIRITSPNFSSSYQFNPQMNEGLDKVYVTCQFKPYNPYIKIQPNFKGLYGYSNNDGRGLICSGDFSTSQVTDAWRDYELQNKNYQLMFNREIENQQINNAVQREREQWGIASGTLSAGVSGAAAGMMVGGPVGAVAGLGTGALSLAGGLRDLQLNDKLRNEALDYKRDMFGYQLGNIKALPNGLAKTSAIAPDNRYMPFIEYYSCTPIEKQALKDKIEYNGATIMRIGKINDFKRELPTYIKGKLIRLETIDEDYHILNALANEINMGVFI